MGSRPQARGEAVLRFAPASSSAWWVAAAYSLAGCAPAKPASASTADSILPQPAVAVNQTPGRWHTFRPE